MLSVRHTGSRFARDLVNIAHLGFEGGLKMLSIRHTGNRFKRDLVNIAHLGFEVGLKMLSIRLDLIESTRVVSLAVDLSYRKSRLNRLPV